MLSAKLWYAFSFYQSLDYLVPICPDENCATSRGLADALMIMAMAGIFILELFPLIGGIILDVFYGVLILFPAEYADAILSDMFNVILIYVVPILQLPIIWWNYSKVGITNALNIPTVKDDSFDYFIDLFFGAPHESYLLSTSVQAGMTSTYLLSRGLKEIGI